MSSALAIAGVTYLLRDLLNNGVVDNKLDTNVKITAGPPLREGHFTVGQSQLNLFLYHLTPNAAWRNVDLPGRDAAGARVANLPLALDLHYLISAYDERDCHAEALLGYAAQLLHENPGFSREQIRGSLKSTIPDDAGTGLPETLRNLALTGLADQIEAIRIVPHYLSTEEMFKIWTGFQAPYRPSLAYQVSAILIQAERPARTPLPVLTRGRGDVGPTVQASLLPPLPTLQAALPADRQPAARPDGKIKLFGHHLRGTGLEVVLSHMRQTDCKLTVADSAAPGSPVDARAPDPAGADAAERLQIPPGADTCLVVDLGKARGQAAAGWHSVSVSVVLPTETQSRQSNAITIAIAPAFAAAGEDAPEVTPPPAASGSYQVALSCTPEVRPGQSAVLLLGPHELRLSAPVAAATGELTFVGPLPGAGSYLARLRVDGVDSLFIERPNDAPPSFMASQIIAIP